MCGSFISPHLWIATKGQSTRVCGKSFLSSVVPLVVNGGSIVTLTQLPRNARRDFFLNTAKKNAGVVSL